MKVLIVNNMAPFVRGGAEELAASLCRNIAAAGHEAEIMRIPFQWEPASRIPSQMLMVRAFDLYNVDQVIALKFPAYLVRHPRKTFWLVHQYRQAYDLHEAGHTNLPPGEAGERLRSMIVRADEESFREARKIFTISETTRDRLRRFNGIEGQVLVPPLNDPELFTGGEPRGYILAAGRINSMKRQHLLVEALALAPRGVRLVVAGPADSPADAERLAALAETLGVADRLKLDLRFMTRADVAAYVNGASAVAYVPFDEDALSFVAMEAATAAKPILSATDSGGVLGLAKDGATGWVVEPEPASLARAMAAIAADPGRARGRGLAARALLAGMDVAWPATIGRLLS